MDSAIKRIQAAGQPNEPRGLPGVAEEVGEHWPFQHGEPMLAQLPPSTPRSLEDCPLTTRQPPSDALQQAADVYFRFCHNQPYSLFHEASFRSLITSGQVADSLGWALLAVARRYSEIPNFSLGTSDDALKSAELAWDCLELSWNRTVDHQDAITTIQTILLIVNIENPAGHCNSAYLKLGLALRFATLHGLHREPDAKMPFHLQEEHRRTFWSLYLQDRLISLSKDRFSTIRDESCTVHLPCSEVAFRDGLEEHVPSLRSFTGADIDITEAERCSPLSLIPVIASLLDRVSQFALQEVVSAKPIAPWSSFSPLTTLSSTLLQLEHLFGMDEPIEATLHSKCFIGGAVDPRLAGSFIYAKALFHLSQCLLYHPFLLGQKVQKLKQRAPLGFMKQAWNTCRAHAKSLTDLESLRHLDLSTMTSLYGYCIMVAGTVHVFSLVSEEEAVREEGEKHYAAALDFLQGLSTNWKQSALMAHYLVRFRQLGTDCIFDPCCGPDSSSKGNENDEDSKVLWRSVDYALLLTPESTTGEVLNHTEQLSGTSLLEFPGFDVFSGLDCDDLDLFQLPGMLPETDLHCE